MSSPSDINVAEDVFSMEQEEHDNSPSVDVKEDDSEVTGKISPKKFKHGVIYLSRIPEKMTPNRIRQMLGKYGEIGRVFLQPEDDYLRQQRKKRGGTPAKLYTEGWVEFKRKKIAKRVALTLHNTSIGERKKDPYYDELWSLKYLPGFKWAHLVERQEYEKQVRVQRGRMELSQIKKDTAVYIRNVEQSKKLEKMQQKRLRQGKEWTHRTHQFRQKRTEDEIITDNPQKKSGKISKTTLHKLFNKS